SLLAPAHNAGLTHDIVADKLGALGGTPFHLRVLDSSALAAGLHLPVSELKELRRALVTALDAALARVEREVAAASAIESVRASLPALAPLEVAPAVVPLCRTDAQLDAVLDAGAAEVELD